MRGPHEPSGGVLPSLIVECDREPADERAGRRRAATRPRAAPRGWCCARAARSRALDPGGSAVGFHVLPSFDEARLVELTRSETSSPLAAERAERCFAALGKHVAWVGDAPGLVLGRIVCQVINESAFALGEGVGDAARHRHRHDARAEPPARAARVGRRDRPRPRAGACSTRCASEYREERYRPAPALRRLVAAGRTGRAAGAGFFDYRGPEPRTSRLGARRVQSS